MTTQEYIDLNKIEIIAILNRMGYKKLLEHLENKGCDVSCAAGIKQALFDAINYVDVDDVNDTVKYSPP